MSVSKPPLQDPIGGHEPGSADINHRPVMLPALLSSASPLSL